MAEGFERDVHCLLGLPFDAVDMGIAAKRVQDAAARRRSFFVSTPNLNFIVACLSDSKFRDSVINSDLSLADGMPLVWIARLLGVPIQERVAGSSLFEHLRQDDATRLSVYFFGGPEGQAGEACRRLNAERSGLVCAGYAFPGFGPSEQMSSEATIARINSSGADFLVVSLGAKKGQEWIERNRVRIAVPIISHLGAVLNIVAGGVNRAPTWMQNAGLEWLWRIKEEPALWRRYLFDGTAFVRLMFTRVLPLAWNIHRYKPSDRELEVAKISLHTENDAVVIRVHGVWTRKNLWLLQQPLAEVHQSACDLRVDLGDVSFVDTSFLGQLMLLYGAQKKKGKRFSCAPVNARIRKIIEYSCCEFLLASGQSDLADVTSRAVT